MAYLIALLIISVITTMISKMTSPAILSHEPYQLYFSQDGMHRPAISGESR